MSSKKYVAASLAVAAVVVAVVAAYMARRSDTDE
jgi:hypothetical protein